MDELELLLQQQRELQSRIEQKRQEIIERDLKLERERQEQEEKRRRELELEPRVLNVKDLNLHNQVGVELISRPDIMSVIRSFSTGTWQFGGRNWKVQYDKFVEEYWFNLGIWNSLRDSLSRLPNVTFTYAKKGLEEKIEEKLNAPNWHIGINNKYIILTPRFDSAANITRAIPGLKHDNDRLLAPLAEAPRVWEIFEPISGVVYTDEARDFIANEVSRQLTVDAIILRGENPEISERINYASDIKLRPFQEVGVTFADVAQSCIIADEMGLGKTIQGVSIALLHDLQLNVVVCPANLKANWMAKIKEYTGYDAYPLTGRLPQKSDIIHLVTNRPKWIVLNYELVGGKVTMDVPGSKGATVDRFMWAEVINALKPQLLLIDEGHYIKDMGSARSRGVRTLKADRIIFLTGTPVINRPGELFPMLTMIRPEMFTSKEAFLWQYTVDGVRPRNIDQLQKILKGIMIRRTKKDVLKDLPPINRIYETHELSVRATELYNKVLRGVYERVAAFDPRGIGGDTQKVPTILAQITRLKQVCAIDSANFTVELAQEMVDSNDETKVLVYSHFKAVAYNIYRQLNENNEALCFIERSGRSFDAVSNPDRYRLVREFTNDPRKKFLIVTEGTAAEGLDITAASKVIFNDLFWTPKGHQQSEGRAYGRLNDPHPIDSYYVIANAKIIKWIQELLKLKMDIIEQVVDGVEAARQYEESIVKELIRRIKGEM